MKHITFFDTEVEPASKKITDIGCITDNGDIFHSNSIKRFYSILKNSEFLCGHNIINHDLKYLKNSFHGLDLNSLKIIDTLYLSPLLFPKRPYHRLVKDDKLLSDDFNNPVNDSKKVRDLFFDEVTAFNSLDNSLRTIFYSLLHSEKEFKDFFHYISFFNGKQTDLLLFIKDYFKNEICSNVRLDPIITEYPIELAYCLSLIYSACRFSITPPWLLQNFPEIDRILFLLRDNPCSCGCSYCKKALDPVIGIKKYFGFHSFRTYDGEPLQENAVKAALENKSLLAIFPTGGGKSVTFQIPALMAGENSKGLTVVISPLQSLMKDQVDNLEKIGNTESVTINGLLDPIERCKSFERVENG
ncbi:MAG: DEAD/DEAH box helicase, partial [Chitinispirillia bacterium]